MRALVILMVATGVASAQPAAPAAPAPAQAPVPASAPEPASESAFKEGRSLIEAGKYAEACATFTELIKLDPDAPGTLLNLGLCNEKLGKTATALAWYRKAQFRSAEAGMADYETAAKQQTVVLAAKVPTLRIEAPADIAITLDGNALSEVERARVEVDPGTHVLEAGSVTKAIDVRDGDKQTIDLRPPPAKRYVVVDRGVAQRRLGYLAMGAGGAFYVASTTLALVGRRKYDAAEHPEDYYRWQDIVRYGGTSMFVVGSAAIVTGVFLYVKAPRAERIEQVAPIIAPDHVGVAVAGSF